MCTGLRPEPHVRRFPISVRPSSSVVVVSSRLRTLLRDLLNAFLLSYRSFHSNHFILKVLYIFRITHIQRYPTFVVGYGRVPDYPNARPNFLLPEPARTYFLPNELPEARSMPETNTRGYPNNEFLVKITNFSCSK